MFMIESSYRRKRLQRIGFCLLLAIAGSLFHSPDVSAQTCTNNTPSGGAGEVRFEGCTEAKNSSNVTSVSVPYPAGINSGDLLIIHVATDGNEGFQTPSGWIKLVDENQGGANLAAFKRIADGTEAGNETINWGSGETVLATMLRFSQTTGNTEVVKAEGTSATPTAPAITPGFSNYMALRLGSFDQGDITPDLNPVIAGHTNINQDESGTANPDTSGSSAFLNFTSGGTAPAANFTLTAAEGSVRATIAIEFGTPGTPTPASGLGCPRTDGSFSGSQLVVMQECTEGRTTGGTSINIGVPGAVANGDVMLAVVSTDATETITEPGAWTLLSEATSDTAVTVGVYSRIADSEPGSYTWNIGSNEHLYGYIMLFKGASGQAVTGFASRNNNQSPATVNVTTLAENSLIVSLIGSDDDDIDIDPAEIVPGQTNVTADRSGAGGGATSGQAVYVNQPATGGTGQIEFYHLANEQSHVGTVALEPIEFRFSMSDTSASVCAIQQVTLSVTDRLGNPMTNFTGTVDLSIETTIPADAIGAQWLDLDSSLNGTLTDIGDGVATYQFSAADNGVAVFDFNIPNGTTVDFDLVFDDYGPTFVENSSFDPALTVDENCEFRIEHDGSDNTCTSGEDITITLVDSDGNPADFYEGTVEIDLDLGSGGTFVGFTGSGTLDDALPDDGDPAEYTFDLADGGQVVLTYENTTADTYNFNAVDSTTGFITDTDLPASYDPDLVLEDCEVRITIADGLNQSDVCSLAEITFVVTDSSGTTIPNYVGTINISTDTGTGDWTDFVGAGSGTNAVNNGAAGDGVATYLFDVADGSDVILNFENPFLAGALGFVVSGTASNGAPIADSATVNETLEVLGCTVDIQAATGTAELCEAGETVTYTIRDRNTNPSSTFSGLLVLNNDTGNGDYSPSGENGTFDNGSSNDGIATYTFDPADNGVLTVTFTNGVAETVNLTASSSGVTLDGGSDADVQFNACEFRIAYTDGDAGTTDVCSVEQIQIGIYNSSNSLVAGYTGTINLSTTTGNGTWSDPGATALGTLTDPVAEDGSATYEFVAGDGGQITLDFTDLTNEVANINISDGTTTDPGDNMDPNDPDLTVDLCTFRISYDGGATADDAITNACSVQQVTITLVDRLGGNPEVNYQGTVNISTSTLNGNWSGGGSGTLIDTPGDDDGVATYQFSSLDANTVTLDFSDLNGETVNINLIDGVIIEDGLFDPDLEVQSCLPSIVGPPFCAAGGSVLTTSVDINAENTNTLLQGRMVVVATAMEGTGDVTGVTFDGFAMTQIYDERINEATNDNNTELWGILDVNMPDIAGTFDVDVTHTDNDLAMCAFYIEDVEQAFPVAAVPGEDGPVNGSQEFDPNTTVAATIITPSANNSLVLSIVSNGSNGDYNNVEPEPPFTRLFNGPDPDSAVFAGSSGIVPIAATTTVFETPSIAEPNRHTHIVASFSPLVTGPPIAVGYEPVILFETYSGNLSYRAIGNSFRNAANPSSCTFDTTSSATLTLPDEPAPPGFDSTVEAAYLYWFASGDDALGQTDANVTFTDPSLTATNITADDIFLIDNVGGSNNNDYFAGYKDVTPLVTGNGTYTVSNLTIQNGTPWSNTQACAGGWALVVVYDNPYEQLRVINLFHGFQPFQNSAFTLVPRNFRMATPNDTENLPNGQVTHVTVEGDETIFNGDESLQIQDAPGSTSYTPLVTYYNPLQAEFNGTITSPRYVLTDIGGGVFYYLFDPSDVAGGADGAGGYDIAFPGPDVGDELDDDINDPTSGDEIGANWGVDIDTHYISGDGNTADGDDDVLNLFAIAEAEEITTRYSSGQDLVLLVSEVISVTNAPIADIEIFKNEVGTFKVNQTGTYEFVVTNNGNGATSFGSATGEITLSDTLPAGMTFAAAGDVSGDGWVCSVTLDPGAFTCTFDITTEWTLARGANVAGELGETFVGSGVGESLPTLTAVVQIDGVATFPNLSNNVKNVGRVIHSDGNCTVFADGVSPNPSDCDTSPEFDNVNDLQGGAIDINTLEDKNANNNNIDSVTTDVRGVETDLSIEKFVNGVLEEGSGFEGGQYTIRVSNLGPDTTTDGFFITDVDPGFITFNSVVADADWNCSTITPTLSCEYVGPGLAPASTKDLLLNVTVDGVEGDNVTNTAQVTVGSENFDTNAGNDSDTDITAIIAPPVAANEKFLLSVSTAIGDGGPTDLAALDSFQDEDLVLYDPILDEATLFFDHSATAGADVEDINALHLLPNGHIILSADPHSGGTHTLGGISFDESDLVRYDPINNTAVLIFDGSAIFTDAGENIDAVYVLDNGNLVISTTGVADIGGTSFDQSDLVEYDPGGGTATILVDGSDSDVFNNTTTQLDAAYIRVDPLDATGTIDTYAVSVDDLTANIGAGGTPPGGTNFTRDDVSELNRTDNESQNLFLGNVPLGVFTDDGTGIPDPELRLDGLHIIEDGYFGTFGISQSQAGTLCEAGKITIRKQQGLTTDPDTDYFGTILITTSTGTGTWGLDSGSGLLLDAVPGDGAAVYTFVPGDNGEVTLSLSVDVVTLGLNVDVTNGFVEEASGQDPDFDFNAQITVVTYEDFFDVAGFLNNDGSANWAGGWVEEDDADGVNGGNSGAGVSSGNVRISGGELSLTSNPSTDATGRDPSMTRSVDLSGYNATETFFLEFDYRYASLDASDSIVVEVSDDGTNWEAFPAYTGLTGAGGPIFESLNVSTLGGAVDSFDGTLSVRFRINNGYTLASTFFIDNVELRTGSSDCGITAVDHYSITHIGTGIQCLASDITIQAHDATHAPVAPPNGEVMTLSTSTGKGTWAFVVSGAATLVDLGAQGSPANTDGNATYTWNGVDDEIVLRFNYTDPTANPEAVNFNLGGTYMEDMVTPGEDDDLLIYQAGLRFYNETAAAAGIPTQIAGKPSNVGYNAVNITLEALQTSPEDPTACVALFPDSTFVDIEFAAECDDPDTCTLAGQQFSVNGTNFNAQDANGTVGADTYTTVSVEFTEKSPSRNSADLVLTYQDAGQLDLHARYDIRFNNDPDFLVTSEDFLVGTETFVVRPFGFHIDFDMDRELGTNDSVAADADGSAFVRAGESFDTTVTGIVWELDDDDQNNDGIPDEDAVLTDNAVTPNFGNESDTNEDDVVISHVLVEPALAIGTRDGTLSGGAGFTDFAVSTAEEPLQYDEVGIIRLNANMADNDYLGGGEDVQGSALNVGRFYPHNFNLTSAVTTPVYTSGNSFTYMGQEFTTSFILEARNASDVITQNYFGDFVKLDALDFDNDNIFHAVEDVDMAADNDYTSRLISVDGSFTANWDDFGQAAPGTGSIMGDLIFERENDGMGVDGAEDGPFTVSISTSATDSDSVPITLSVPQDDIDVDDGVTEPGTLLYRRIGANDIEFRYGRLLIDNAFGPETEPLEISLRIEYWNGTEFLTNVDDDATSFLLDVTPPGSGALDFVADTYVAPADALDELADGDTVLEEGEISDVTINLFGGVTGRMQDGDMDETNDTDRPFITSAPDPLAANGTEGSVLIEFDLDHASLPFSLDFLSYDWRTDPEVDEYDEIPDDDYTDNPRGIVEFGSYRGHDRVINWQEIYIQN